MAINNYVTLAQVKAYMPTNEVAKTNVWDGIVTTLCTNESRAFDTLTYRKPGAYAVTDDVARYFDGIPATATDYASSLFTDELAAVPTLLEASPQGNPDSFAPWAASDYFCWPYNAADDGKPYLRLDLNLNTGQHKTWPSAPRSIRVTGKFGYSTTVPADVLEALLLLAVRMIRKAQQNYLEVGQLLDSGQVMVGMKTDYDLQALIASYRKSRV